MEHEWDSRRRAVLALIHRFAYWYADLFPVSGNAWKSNDNYTHISIDGHKTYV